MARVVLTPEQFSMVFFDAQRIVDIAEEAAAAAGLPDDFEVRVDVDETTPFGNTRSTLDLDGRRFTIEVQSGAFDDPKDPRNLSERGTRLVLARLLFRAADRCRPEFADAPHDTALTYEQYTAWDAYALGRHERLGHDGERSRRRYHFRLRHGFTDVADRVFDRLWAGEGLTWADLDAACTETAAARDEAAA